MLVDWRLSVTMIMKFLWTRSESRSQNIHELLRTFIQAIAIMSLIGKSKIYKHGNWGQIMTKYRHLAVNRIVQAAAASLLFLFAPTTCQAAGLDDLCYEKSFTAHRISSVDPNHKNQDFRSLAPGQTLALGEIEGKGKVEHIWFTIAASSPDYLRELVLRIYWDGESRPAVECPLGEFYGLGFGKMVEYKSAATAIGAQNSLNCYWPMPFKKGARFTITNEGKEPVGSCYYNIDYSLDQKEDNKKALYFHTQYRQSYPAPKGKDLPILDVQGRGQFVGCFLSVLANSDLWWGEGNDKFYVDGATAPTIEGTGSEDYFCGAWDFGHSFYTDYCGVPLYEPGEKRGIHNTCYRWHIMDPVPFTTSLQFNIEHGRNGSDDERSPLLNNYSTVAYYYVDHPGGEGPALPPCEQRKSQLLPLP